VVTIEVSHSEKRDGLRSRDIRDVRSMVRTKERV